MLWTPDLAIVKNKLCKDAKVYKSSFNFGFTKNRDVTFMHNLYFIINWFLILIKKYQIERLF